MSFEKVAERTNGWVTPSNALSVAGGVATLAGLEAYKNGEAGKCLLLAGHGRVADLLDGHIARVTNTASQKGEALDAAIDKTLMLRALMILTSRAAISGKEVTGLAIHNGLSIAGSMIAKARGKEIHPSKAGKRATALEWTGIGFGVLADTELVAQRPELQEQTEKLRKIVLWSGIIVGTISAVNYVRESLK